MPSAGEQADRDGREALGFEGGAKTPRPTDDILVVEKEQRASGKAS